MDLECQNRVLEAVLNSDVIGDAFIRFSANVWTGGNLFCGTAVRIHPIRSTYFDDQQADRQLSRRQRLAQIACACMSTFLPPKFILFLLFVDVEDDRLLLILPTISIMLRLLNFQLLALIGALDNAPQKRIWYYLFSPTSSSPSRTYYYYWKYTKEILLTKTTCYQKQTLVIFIYFWGLCKTKTNATQEKNHMHINYWYTQEHVDYWCKIRNKHIITIYSSTREGSHCCFGFLSILYIGGYGELWCPEVSTLHMLLSSSGVLAPPYLSFAAAKCLILIFSRIGNRCVSIFAFPP